MEGFNTLSETLFYHQREVEKLQDKLFDILLEHGVMDWIDISYDDYDNSLEIYEVPENCILNLEQKKVLKDFGFGQVWTHHKKYGEQGYVENWYSLRDFNIERVNGKLHGG